MLTDDQKLKAALEAYLDESDGITVWMPSEVVHAMLSRVGSEAVTVPIDMVLLCPEVIAASMAALALSYRHRDK